MSDATIIVGKLNDEELRKSIDSLVTHIKSQTDVIKSSFDGALSSIESKVKGLSNVKADNGVDVASTQRATQAVKERTQATKELNLTLDQQQIAMQKGTGRSQVLEQYDAQLIQLRERLAEVTKNITIYQNALASGNKLSLAPWYEAQLPKAKQEIEQLTIAIQKLEAQRANLRDVLSPGDSFKNYVNSLTKANPELALLNQQFKEGKSLLQQQAKAEDAAKNSVDAYVASVKSETQAQREAATDAKLHAEAIKELAAAARERHKNGYAYNMGTRTSDGRPALIYPENDVRAKGLTIEQQISQLLQENARLYHETTTERQKQLEIEKAISSEYEKRSKYIKPDTLLGYDITSGKMRSIIASKLGIDAGSVVNWDEQTSSIKRLSTALKQYQDAYGKLTAEERNSPFGKQMISDMQVIERNIKNLRKEMSRPISLAAAMSGSEKTLDDIAYKIQRLQSYKRGINITDPRQVGEIRQVDAEINRLNADLQKYMATTQKAHSANNALTRSWNYMKNRLAFYFTIGASTQFVKQIIDVRSQYELLERSIGTLIDSAQNGSKIFAELNAMAIKSPFTTMELGAAAKQLVAYDVAAKDVVDTTRRLADMAAAAGIPLERLTYALGHIKAYGYLNARDARMFANAGIPLAKELAEYYTRIEGQLVSTADVYDRIKKKAVEYKDVMEVINDLTDEGGRFYNFQEKVSDTLKIRLANLTLAWNNMLNEMGKDSQGFITSFIEGLKKIFEHWRDIENILYSIVATFGILKTAQIAYLVLTSKTITATRSLAILQMTLGNRIANGLASLGAFFANPVALAAAALATLSVAIGKAIFDYKDLQKANEQFNKSIADAAEENIKSIEKFFTDYKDELFNVAGASEIDQSKMWERVREEIEKSTKAAEQYIKKLEDINDIAERIKAGEKVLEQTQIIEQEIKRLADEGRFNLGGGFMDDSLLKNLKQVDEETRKVIKNFGSLDALLKKGAKGNVYEVSKFNTYTESISEAEKELERFVKILNNADISKIMGEDPEMQLTNIRNFANGIRDALLATEDGTKVASFGIAKLNSALDKWVAKTAWSKGVIEDDQEELIESSRTAWEAFFNQLNKSDKKRLDYFIDTHRIGSDEFKELWKKATKNFAKNSTESYNLIKTQLEDLSKTPPIVIRLIYRQQMEVADDQTKAFYERFIKPKSNLSMWNMKAYFDEQEKNTKTYGKFIKKQGEDNVEWEKRLGETYQNNIKNIAALNAQLKNSAHMSDVDRQAKEKHRDALIADNKALDEIRKVQGFNYDQFEKGKNKNKGTKKDPLGDALAKYAQLITDMQKRYKEFRQIGVNTTDALRFATSEYGETLSLTNAVLNKFGIVTKNNDELAKMDLHALRDYFNAIKGVASTKGSAKGLEAIEKALASINVEITKADYTKIVDGLNSELGKLKEEYELGVELSTDPEMGDMFAKAFNIDVEALPKSFGEALDKANEIVKDKLKELKIDIHNFGLLDTLIEPDMENKWAGLDFNSKPVQDLIKLQKTWRDMFTNIMKENEKVLDDYVKKYGNYSDRVAELEADRLEKIKRLNDRYREDQRSDPDYKANMAAIEQGTSKELGRLRFEEFKNSQYYVAMFEDIEHASSSALSAIRDRLSSLKDSLNELSPEQMKWVVQQYEKINQELLSRNPFKGLAGNVKNYIEALKKGGDAQEKFLQAQDEYDAQLKQVTMWKTILKLRERGTRIGGKEIQHISKMSSLQEDLVSEYVAENDINNMSIDQIKGQVTEADKLLQTLYEILQVAQANNDKFNYAKKILKDQGVAIAKAVGQNLQSLGELRDFITQDLGIEISAELDGMVDGLTKTGEGVNKIVSSLENADFVGALVGVGQVFYGLYDTVASIFGGGSAREKRITRQIEESERAVKRLENTYKSLEHTASNAYGAMTSGASYATKANKELQLVELQRQLVLEKSRKKKKQDQDKIIELEGQIMDLKNELNDATRDIVNDLLGISSAGDGIENLVSVMIEAFRNGEDAMEAFGKEWDKMIDNMILKLIVSTFMQKEWDKIMAYLNKREEEMLKSPADAVQKAQAEYDKIAAMSDAEIARIINPLGSILGGKTVTPQQIKDYREAAKKALTESTEVLNKASYDYTKWTMEYMNTEGRAQMTSMAELLKNSLGDWYTFGENNAKDLSALQAGIQGITEETAGALEAYMNSISQQVYLQSNILTQIRDAVLAIDHNAQTATQAEMLLQMQNNYILMQTMQSMMENWTVPSGQGIRVELMS